MLTAVLRSLQAHVVAARNVEEAEVEVQFSRPHLIVCDLKLPDGTGLEFLQWLRARRHGANIPCIAITGWKDHFGPDVARHFEAFMVKPVNLDEFCNTAVALVQR